jgi:hypothetical protein
LIEESRELPADLARALEQISQSTRSIQLLAELLERQPESILRGKGR